MQNKISGWFYKFSTGKRTLLFLLIFFLFSILVLPKQSADAASYGGDVGSPDLSFFYSSDDLYQMAEAYGEEGRRKYILSKFTIDLAWPFVFTLLYMVFINLSLGYVHGARGAGLSVLALTTLAFDYLENILAAVVMTAYPAKFEMLTWVLSFTTCLKWTSMGLVSLLFFYGLLAIPICFIYIRIKKYKNVGGMK